jgi:peptidoglycan/LPS O-acetylase OafA/YrhL
MTHSQLKNEGMYRAPHCPPILEKSDLYQYRSDIDGLRGLAVIAVIVFHINAALLPGGFTGVDIFFVISGYVVTASILRRQSKDIGDYFATFYKRRLLRLLPALLACIFLTTVIAGLFVKPDSLSPALSVGGRALIGWSNNYLIASSSDYFGLSAELNPFTHTWSLGVEEQFYFIFPMILASLYGLRRPVQNKYWAVVVLTALVVGSAGLCSAFARTDIIRAYYYMPSRFWEMASGALLFSLLVAFPKAVKRLQQQRWLCWVSQLLAVILIVGSFIFVSSEKNFPMPGAIFPTAGAFLLIASGINENSYLRALLSARPWTYLGEISYSLYLWHWPVAVIFRWTIGLNSVSKSLAAIMLTAALSLASYYWIERPVRKMTSLSCRRVFVMAIGGILMTGMCTVAVAKPLQGSLYLYREFNSQDWLATPQQIIIRNSQISGNNCKISEQDTSASAIQNQFETCTVSAVDQNKPHIFVFGDSHARALSPMFDEVHKKLGLGVTMVFSPGCLVSAHISSVSNDDTCPKQATSVFELIKDKMHPGDIVLGVSRYSGYLSDKPPISWLERSSYEGEGLLYIDGKAVSKTAARQYYSDELAAMAKVLASKGVSFVIPAPIPEHYFSADQCLPTWFSVGSGLKPECFTARSLNLNYRETTIDSLQKAQKISENIYIWDVFDKLCPGDNCAHFKKGKPLFYDDDHISVYGSRSLAPNFVDFLKSHNLIAETT